jgi:hypothetical protein
VMPFLEGCLRRTRKPKQTLREQRG